MKKILAIFLMIIILIIAYAILDTPSGVDEDYIGFNINANYPLDTASSYNGDIYFIGKDNKLYRLVENLKQEVYFDEPMTLFVITNEYLIYVDMDGLLHVTLQYQFINKTIDLDVKDFRECIIFDRGMIYQEPGGKLIHLEYFGWQTDTIVIDEVLQYEESDGKVVYSVRNKNNTIVNIFDPYDGEIELVINKRMNEFMLSDGYIYYNTDRSVYRANLYGGISERLAAGSNIKDFAASKRKMLTKPNEDIFRLFDLSRGKVRDINGQGYSIVKSKDDMFLCINDGSSSILLISPESDLVIENDVHDEIVGMGFIGDYVFVQVGIATDEKVLVENLLLYDYDGNIVFEH